MVKNIHTTISLYDHHPLYHVPTLCKLWVDCFRKEDTATNSPMFQESFKECHPTANQNQGHIQRGIHQPETLPALRLPPLVQPESLSATAESMHGLAWKTYRPRHPRNHLGLPSQSSLGTVLQTTARRSYRSKVM